MRMPPSLPGSYRTVAVPRHLPWWRRLLAFLGPGYLVSVGYMDPGNWATDLAAGSRFGYRLLFVIGVSSLMAMLLQTLCVRLGLGAQLDLAQACRRCYPRPVTLGL
jgi:manganese transport protein